MLQAPFSSPRRGSAISTQCPVGISEFGAITHSFQRERFSNSSKEQTKSSVEFHQRDSLDEIDEKVNSNLKKLFITENYVSSLDNEIRRVIANVSKICNKFIRERYLETCGRNKNPWKIAGKIFPYGSYLLGTHGQNSDIDLLLACPKFITKTSIFSKLYSYFDRCPDVKDLKKIELAHVPLLKFYMFNIRVDLSYAIFDTDNIDQNLDVLDDTSIDRMDQSSLVSFNGVRTTTLITKLVPDMILYRSVVRLLKMWAKKRILTGNVFGYFGGINLSLIAAYVCQKTTQKIPSRVILDVFTELGQWNWPDPMMINNIKITENRKSWSPSNDDIMPIITPSYPAINSMKNATRSTLHRIKLEVSRAQKYTQLIVNGEINWETLLAPPHFFSDYKMFIQILFAAPSKKEFAVWQSVIELNLNKLTVDLETNDDLNYAILFPHAFPDQEETTTNQTESSTQIKNQNQTQNHAQTDKGYSARFYYAITYKRAKFLSKRDRTHEDKLAFIGRIMEDIQAFQNRVQMNEVRKDGMTVACSLLKREKLPDDVLTQFGSHTSPQSPISLPVQKYRTHAH
ncbi:poly(A) polymerase [Tritrichomonas foetus]|uniref:polynucleotide adenylyltransferase n=1 Tax=Tritrichomonas foetus TaxID=1144522 RepID=A0A1J4K9P9_9EUKA|nr:poly(A) polymerase [Tritrichomonas foetus]|eukprot:OHT08193.1 poly(A) polymerase [Tritrichomonas foetus]